MKFRAKFKTNEYNNTFVIIQVKKLLFWKDLYRDLTNGIDGTYFWPVMTYCSSPYNPDVNNLLNRLRTDEEERKKYYIKTLFGYKKL
jgi:hypothetical protein